MNPAPVLCEISDGIATLTLNRQQFARDVPTRDLRDGLDAWIERRLPAFEGR